MLVTGTALLLRWCSRFFLRDVGDAPDGYRVDDSYRDALAFVARNSISRFTYPDEHARSVPGGTLMLIGERFAAVTLLALVVFAIRSRVAR